MLQLLPSGEGPLQILCLGAHCDDIEIGCGATVRQLVAGNREVTVRWVVLSSNAIREQEARESAARFLDGVDDTEILVQQFRNGYFPYVGAELKDYFEVLKSLTNPDIVFTHYRHDRHQDHRTVSDLTWNTFRNHWILEYEIPKYDGDLGQPNVFSPVSKEAARFKVSTILDCFRSQTEKGWFEPSTFDGLMRLRGVECNSSSGFAEAFYVRKTILGAPM